VLGDARNGGPGVDLDDGLGAAPEALLLLTLVLLGPLAAIAFALRHNAPPVTAPVPVASSNGDRPLLFLDIDGVIALSPWSPDLPPGRVYTLGYGLTYVPDAARELVGRLASRFELVWASGWEHQANSGLLTLLGLDDELPVLTFGNKARHGSSDWKIDRIDRYARSRPAAWVDDHFDRRHVHWASDRPEPTLLIPVDPRAGISEEHVERLLEWAASTTRTATSDGTPSRS